CDPGAVKPAENKRTEPPWIANRVHFVAREHEQRVRAFYLTEGIGESARQISRRAARYQMHDHFGVAGGLKDRAAMLKFAAQLQCVGQIAVVAKRDLALVAVDHDGLRVDQRGIACSGIASVADRRRTGKARDDFGRENFLDESKRTMIANFEAISGSDAGRFLSAMLQRVDA